MFIDVHAHLLEAEEIPKHVIIVNNGTNPETNRKAVELSKRFGNIKCALGLYPSYAVEMAEREIKEEIIFIRKQLKDKKITAIGEVGLDFTYAQKEKQIEVFKKFIALSKEFDCPLIIHSRKAEKDVIKILKEENAKKAILHCFSGRLKLAKEAEKLGFYFSIPAIIVYSMHFQELAKAVSLSKLLTETDSPYLSPEKGEKNNPKNVMLAVKAIAKIKGISEQECENIIFANFQKLFC
ncbi:TatD family hydrolase [archaeon]|nr:TatD family hydrolase [archaeon]